MTLDISAYDGAEATAEGQLGNLAQAAFKPVTFSSANYPIRVRMEAELQRFVDTMHENAAGSLFSPTAALSPDEADLIRTINDKVVDLTRTSFGRPIRPWLAHLDAVGMFRVVAAWAGCLNRPNASILEIGPGSGYLGALLSLAGYRYMAMDNTQAFYLWQNRLFAHLAGSGLLELADQAIPREDDPSKTVVHIPWWHFAELHRHNPFSADFVVCDHALGEISLNALRYILRTAHAMLTRNATPGLFLFRFTGARHISNDRQLFKEFERAGMRAISKRLFYALAPIGSPWDKLAFPPEDVTQPGLTRRILRKMDRSLNRAGFGDILALDQSIPRWNPSGRGGSVIPVEAVPIHPGEAPADYDFVSACGIAIPKSV